MKTNKHTHIRRQYEGLEALQFNLRFIVAHLQCKRSLVYL